MNDGMTFYIVICLTGLVCGNLALAYLYYNLRVKLCKICEVIDDLADDCASGEIIHSYGLYRKKLEIARGEYLFKE